MRMSQHQNTGIKTPWLAIKSRIETERLNSENAFCDSLVKSFEFLTKYIAILLLSILPPEYDQDRYLWEYRLVRASGLGTWREAIVKLSGGRYFSILNNRFSSLGYPDALEQLTTKVKEDKWQYKIAKAIIESRNLVLGEQSNLPLRTNLIAALGDFVEFRNKFDAHGAPLSGIKRQVASLLQEAFQLTEDNFLMLNTPLIICRKSVTGEASSILPSGNVSLTKKNRIRLGYVHRDNNEQDGLYILDNFLTTRIINLIKVDDINSEDFYIANGSLRNSDRTAEWLSYSSGEIARYSIEQWSIRPPSSETSAYENLIDRGNILTNAPELPEDYISRCSLQRELVDALERRSITTLKGSGGIGKTSLALWAVDKVSKDNQFDVVLWFSSRDIDLRLGGAYEVDPDITLIDDIAQRARELLEDTGTVIDGQPLSSDELLREIFHSEESGRVLWVLDNFETVKDQKVAFGILDRYINHRNNRSHKLLITTRHRLFQGDFPVQVEGMGIREFESLVNRERTKLGISLQDGQVKELFEESNGHPYITKILLGEMKTKRARKAIPIIKKKEDILSALFERTFHQLSNDARHIYLLLCRWSSLVPFVALDLAVNSKGNDVERVDVDKATDELIDYSLVESYESEGDEDWIWFDVPTPSRIFGKNQLIADSLRFSIETEFKKIKRFGVCTPKDRMDELRPVYRYWLSIREEVLRQLKRTEILIDSLGEYYPWFDRLGSSVPQLWSWLAHYLEEERRSLEAEKFYRKAIITAGHGHSYLSNLQLDLANYLEARGKDKQALEAWVYWACSDNSSIDDLSHVANKVNGWLYHGFVNLTMEERKILLKELVKNMESRSSGASAQDLSRLAWLYAHIGDPDNGLKAAQRGLELNFNDRNCRKFIERFAGK